MFSPVFVNIFLTHFAFLYLSSTFHHFEQQESKLLESFTMVKNYKEIYKLTD